VGQLPREAIEPESKKRADAAVDWLRATMVSRLGDPNAFGVVRVEIKYQAGKVPGSVVLVDEVHYR
jgi:hypothetical protein